MSESLKTADRVNKGAKAKGDEDPLFYNGSQYTKHMKNPPPSFVRTDRSRPRHVLPGLAALGLAWACVAVPAFSQSDMPQAWQPGELANTTQTDEHQEVRKLLRQAKYSAALSWIEGSLAKNPRDPQMLFWQAFVFEQTGRADKALPIYLSLTQDFPELPEPHNNLGVLYAAQGDYARAKASFDLAVRNNPSYAVAHENLGDVLLHMSQQSYQRALSLEPKQLSAHKKIQQLKPALELSERK
jgi:tetratricopeptide (TPR) repeat protein